jgi:hypothetical protein
MGNVDETSIEIVLNNKVLSNFASVNCIYLLQDVLSGKGGMVEQVKQEFQRGIALGHLPNVSIDWLPILQRQVSRPGLTFVSADNVLCEAAESEGLFTENPNNYP